MFSVYISKFFSPTVKVVNSKSEFTYEAKNWHYWGNGGGKGGCLYDYIKLLPKEENDSPGGTI